MFFDDCTDEFESCIDEAKASLDVNDIQFSDDEVFVGDNLQLICDIEANAVSVNGLWVVRKVKVQGLNSQADFQIRLGPYRNDYNLIQ